MSERVHRRPDGLLARQAERERGLVDDRDGVRPGAAGLRAPAFVTHAEVRRPLRARIRGRHGDETEAGRRRDRLGGVDRTAATEPEEAVCARSRVGRRRDDVERRMPPDSDEASRYRKVELREPRARHEQRALEAELREQRCELRETPADDHDARRSRANATNASATRVRALPVADASEISRVASSPSTRASARRPAASSDSTAVREMKVTP